MATLCWRTASRVVSAPTTIAKATATAMRTGGHGRGVDAVLELCARDWSGEVSDDAALRVEPVGLGNAGQAVAAVGRTGVVVQRGVADVVMAEKRARVGGQILDVDAEEDDLAGMCTRSRVEAWRLLLARATPACPEVQHDRASPYLTKCELGLGEQPLQRRRPGRAIRPDHRQPERWRDWPVAGPDRAEELRAAVRSEEAPDQQREQADYRSKGDQLQQPEEATRLVCAWAG